MANEYAGGTKAAPVELKVKVAAAATYVGVTTLLYILIILSSDVELLSPLPDAIEPLFISAIPAAVTYLAAWQAKHTPRPDLAP